MEYQAYTTKEEVENYLGVTIDASLNTQIATWIKAITLQIDKMANRDIYKTLPEGETVTYKYDGDGTNIVLIKDCHTITEVRVGDMVVEPLQYPSNKPYVSRLILEDMIFPKGNQNVEVDATHSMAKELPEDIKLAATVMVAGIYNNRNSAGKVGTTERIGSYQVTYHNNAQVTDFETAKMAINGYKRIAI